MACKRRSSANETGLFVNRNSRKGRYRTVSKRSEIDELLFGKNGLDHDEIAVEDIVIPCAEAMKLNCKRDNALRKFQIVNEMGSRTLYESHPNLHQFPLVMSLSEYKKIQKKMGDCELPISEQIQEIREKRREDQISCERRKSEIRDYDLKRLVCQPLNDLELELREKAKFLLKEANEKRMDNFDEIKNLNNRIHSAKISAIRDAQIVEKAQLKKEYKEENERLDKNMEIDRLNQIAIQEEICKKKKQEEMTAATQIFSQMIEKEQKRLLEIEQKNKENEEFRAKWAKEMEMELQKRIEKRERDRKHLEEVFSENSLMMNRKKILKEQDRILDMKMLHEQKIKDEKAEALEKEQLRIKFEREHELARLRSSQKRMIDAQESRDLLQAKRAIESAERKWRKEEEIAVAKREKLKEEIKMTWATQKEQAHHRLAMQTARDENDFAIFVDSLKKSIYQEKLNTEKRETDAKTYKEALVRQIKDKENQRIAEKNAFYDEAIRLEEDERLKQLRVEEAKKRKLKQLYECGLPQKYIDDVMRRFPDLTVQQ